MRSRGEGSVDGYRDLQHLPYAVVVWHGDAGLFPRVPYDVLVQVVQTW